MTVHVGNRRHGDSGEYVGRPSPLGNPFVIGRDGNRKEVVRKYFYWFLDKLTSDDDAFAEELERLIRLHNERDITLVCWCSPALCHADVIADHIRECSGREEE